RQRFRDELGVNSVATSGFRFTLINFGSRYNPNQHLLINNHLAWSREKGDVTNRDNAALSNQNYYEWTWRGHRSIAWAKNTPDFGGEFRRFRQDGSATQFIDPPVLVPAFDRFRGAVREYGAYAQSASTFAHGRGHVAVGLRQEALSGAPVQITTPFASLSGPLYAETRVQFDWGQYG